MEFTDPQRPRLVRVEFRHDDLWTKGTNRTKVDCLAPQSPRLTAGSAAIVLLLLRGRLSKFDQSGRHRVELEGGNGTAASSLHATLEKAGQLAWHEAWFGFDGVKTHLISKCIHKSEMSGRRLVWLNEDLVSRHDVSIHIDGKDISDDERRLRDIQDHLTSYFWSDPALRTSVGRSIPALEASLHSQSSSPLRVAILHGGDFSYVRAIADSFKQRLRDSLVHHPEFEERIGSNALQTWNEYISTLDRNAKNLVDTAPSDYYVAIGTQAAQSLRHALGEARFGKEAKFLFLGVTSPIKMNLVEGLQHRNDELEIAGVGYNDGEVDGMVQRMFRRFLTDEFFDRNARLCNSPRLTFTFCRSFLQDVHQSVALSGTEYHRSNQLEIQELTEIPTAATLLETRVHFGWFTFEAMFQEDRQTRELLSSRPVMATTRSSVKNGWAAMGVAVDDREIGTLGAELILRNQKGEPMGRMPIPCPALKHWVHRGALNRLGLVVPKDAIETATEVFD
ncbi:MAG: hypothetical protein JSS49_02095 [Planctomycetes bacterium]|nr:hypothetical protein [Planctomycetota bacterium]